MSDNMKFAAALREACLVSAKALGPDIKKLSCLAVGEGADYTLPTDSELAEVESTWNALTHGCEIVNRSPGL